MGLVIVVCSVFRFIVNKFSSKMFVIVMKMGMGL